VSRLSISEACAATQVLLAEVSVVTDASPV
jgi:hypothetical protein